MAWTAPLTATTNATFTAAQFNTHVRDNLLCTEAALAPSTSSDSHGYHTAHFVGTGTNAIAARRMASDDANTAEYGTTSSSYTNLSSYGPSITVTTGTQALVMISAAFANDTSDAYAAASFEVSGASTVAASDEWAIETDGIAGTASSGDNMPRRSRYKFVTGLTAGSNTFTMKYRQSGGKGWFNQRAICVWPF